MRTVVSVMVIAALCVVSVFVVRQSWNELRTLVGEDIWKAIAEKASSQKPETRPKPETTRPSKTAPLSGPKPVATQTAAKVSPELTPEMLAAARSEMLQLINEERSKAGVKPLEYYAKADPIAQYRAEDMVKRGYFGHVPPGETPLMATRGDPKSVGCSGLLKRAGILGSEFGTDGENCHTSTATKFEGFIKEAHTSLMNSPGHRANILSDAYTHVSIGISRGSVAGQVTRPNQGYTLVQIFLGPENIVKWKPGKEIRAQ